MIGIDEEPNMITMIPYSHGYRAGGSTQSIVASISAAS